MLATKVLGLRFVYCSMQANNTPFYYSVFFVWQDGGRRPSNKRRHDDIALVEDPHAGLDPASAALEREREVGL
jgi:hypothetical protein